MDKFRVPALATLAAWFTAVACGGASATQEPPYQPGPVASPAPIPSTPDPVAAHPTPAPTDGPENYPPFELVPHAPPPTPETPPRSRPPTPTAAFPESVAGVPFGATPQQVSAICKRAGGTVVPAADFVACTVAPIDPFLTTEYITVGFCTDGGKRTVCEIGMMSQTGIAPATIADLRDKLEGKYGPATPSRPDIGCPTREASHEFRGIWAWVGATEEKRYIAGYLLFHYGCPQGEGMPKLFVMYRDARGYEKATGQAHARSSNF